jgi:hypothetical protein
MGLYRKKLGLPSSRVSEFLVSEKMKHIMCIIIKLLSSCSTHLILVVSLGLRCLYLKSWSLTQTLVKKPGGRKRVVCSFWSIRVSSFEFAVTVLDCSLKFFFLTNTWITIRRYSKNAFTTCPISNLILLVMVQGCVHTLHTKVKSYRVMVMPY